MESNIIIPNLLKLTTPQRAAFMSRADFTWVCGGMGGGKTTAFINLLCAYNCSFGNLSSIALANTEHQLKSATLKNLHTYMHNSFQQKHREDYFVSIQPKKNDENITSSGLITNKNGHKTYLFSAEQGNSVRGQDVNVIFIDEAQDKRMTKEYLTESVFTRARALGLYLVLKRIPLTNGNFIKKDDILKTSFFDEKTANFLLQNGFIKNYNPIFLFGTADLQQGDFLIDFFGIRSQEEQIWQSLNNNEHGLFEYTHDEQQGDSFITKKTILYSAGWNSKNANLSTIISATASNMACMFYGIPFAKRQGLYLDMPEWAYIKDEEYLQNKHLYKNELVLSFDANALPFCTCLVLRQRVLKEYEKNTALFNKKDALQSEWVVIDIIVSKNTIKETCEEFLKSIKNYPSYYCNDLTTLNIKFGGDATLGTAKEGKDRNDTNFADIAKILKNYTKNGANIAMRYVYQKPTQIMPMHHERKRHFEMLQSNGYSSTIQPDFIANFKVLNKKCMLLKQELNSVQTTADDKPLIEKGKNENGVTFEKNGHLLSAFLFICYQIYFPLAIEYKKYLQDKGYN